MNENRINKTCILQVRCTEAEKKRLEKQALKSGMKRSGYMRTILFGNGDGKEGNALFAVKAQELLNYLEENDRPKRKAVERMVDELWEAL